jgi:hypothetical protein
MMEATRTSESSVCLYQNTRRNIVLLQVCTVRGRYKTPIYTLPTSQWRGELQGSDGLVSLSICNLNNWIHGADSDSRCAGQEITFYGTRRFIAVFTSNRCRTQFWARWIQSTPYFVNIHMSIILASTVRYCKWHLPFRIFLLTISPIHYRRCLFLWVCSYRHTHIHKHIVLACMYTHIFLFATVSRATVGPSQPPIKYIPQRLSGTKRPERESNHSLGLMLRLLLVVLYGAVLGHWTTPSLV